MKKAFITLFFLLGIGFFTLSLLYAIIQPPEKNNYQKAHAAEPKKNSADKMCPLPVTPKPDSCKIYQAKALQYLTEVKKEVENGRNGWYISDPASLSAAYSGYYQVCRDLERRESQEVRRGK